MCVAKSDTFKKKNSFKCFNFPYVAAKKFRIKEAKWQKREMKLKAI